MGQQNPVGTATRFFGKHPAIGMTLAYVYVSTIGVVYLWSLFREFGLNVMDFIEADDFLVAAFKNPITLPVLLVFLFSFILLYGVYLWILRWPEDTARLAYAYAYRAGMAFVLLCAGAASIAWPIVAGGMDGIRIRSGQGQEVAVELRSTGQERVQSCMHGELFLIGTTERFAFVYDKPNIYTHIIPISSILQIHYLSEASTWACPTVTPVPSPRPTPQQ